MEAILHGIILSFGLILPLGVQNVFIFSQGATQSTILKALPATITASICDTLLILLAVFGLSVIVLEFEWLRLSLMTVGIIFLIYMGYTIWKSNPTSIEPGGGMPMKKQILFTMSISLKSPYHFRYGWRVRNKCLTLCRNGTNPLYSSKCCRLLVLVFWTDTCWCNHEKT